MAKLRDPQRRALILETAMPLFAERGFCGVSVKDIANASNIALGSIYTYFESKEQLMNEPPTIMPAWCRQ
ncbi:TetR/AcrR family transcriptional regulator [Sorangium sp. So ce1128]